MERLNASECPRIDGIYSKNGSSYLYVQQSGPAEQRLFDERFVKFDFARWAPRNRDFRQYRAEADTDEKNQLLQRSVLVKQHSEEEIVFIEDRAGGDPLKVRLLSSKGDFRCRDGWIVFDEWKYQGGGEGGAQYLVTQVRMTRQVDDKLLVQAHVEHARVQFLFFRTKEVSETYFTFERMR